MSKLVTRVTDSPPAGSGVSIKGSRLTNTEVDENFLSLYSNKLELGGGTLTGALYLHAAPTADLQAATKKYVDDGLAGLSSDAADIVFTPYGNIAATNVQDALEELNDEKLALAGGDMTGNISFPVARGLYCPTPDSSPFYLASNAVFDQPYNGFKSVSAGTSAYLYFGSSGFEVRVGNATTANQDTWSNNDAALYLAGDGNVSIGSFKTGSSLYVHSQDFVIGDGQLLNVRRNIRTRLGGESREYRTMFQGLLGDGETNLGLRPPPSAGAGAATAFEAYRTDDVNNTSCARLAVNSSAVKVESARTGTGTYLPLEFYTGGSLRASISAAGVITSNCDIVGSGVGIRTLNPTDDHPVYMSDNAQYDPAEWRYRATVAGGGAYVECVYGAAHIVGGAATNAGDFITPLNGGSELYLEYQYAALSGGHGTGTRLQLNGEKIEIGDNGSPQRRIVSKWGGSSHEYRTVFQSFPGAGDDLTSVGVIPPPSSTAGIAAFTAYGNPAAEASPLVRMYVTQAGAAHIETDHTSSSTKPDLTIRAAPTGGGSMTFYGGSASVAVNNGMSVSGDVSVAGNLTMSGTGASRRITGDFSHSTHSQRALFQTHTSNSSTTVGAIPSGTGNSSSFKAYNSTDTANANALSLDIVGTTDARIQALAYGTASSIPLTFYTGGSERMRIVGAGGVEVSGGSLAVYGTSTPSNGGSTEIHYLSGEGYVQALDRNGTVWKNLKIQGASLQLRPSNTVGLTVHNTNNVSIGNDSVSAWNAGSAITIGDTGRITFAGVTNTAYVGSNTYYNSAWKYAASSVAAGLLAVSDTMAYYRKASGTAGNTITWDTVLTIDASSNLTMTGNVTAYSDKRLKEGIIKIEGALAKVRKLVGVTFYRKDIEGRKRHMGLLAQDVQSVVPEVVVYDEERDRYGLAYGNLVALLIEAIKEQDARIRTLEEAAL